MATASAGNGWRGAVLGAALVAGASFTIAAWGGWSGPGVVAWKGTGVALLALWAASRAETRDGWTIAAVLALGALGDVLLDAAGLTVGAVAFLAGHLVATLLYWRHRRARIAPTQGTLAIALLAATPVTAFALTGDAGVTLYAFGLGAMAAAAWASAFPRYRTGIGAVLFVASDLLIFARMGVLADSALPRLLVWPTYFAGQALIAWGVVTTLSRRDTA